LIILNHCIRVYLFN